MAEKTDAEYRRACKCNDCEDIRRALQLLDDIACSDELMGCDDIGRLCRAQALLAHIVGATCGADNRYI